MSTKISGQGWARFGLGFGASLSIIGNVAHTVLADSGISLWLRVPFAVAWPLALFIGIEVLVRIDWRRKFVDHAGRALLWGPTGVVAAVVSYLHLHSLMKLAGEDWFSSLIGPLAVDGLMIGCTVALLAIRAASLAVSSPAEISDEELEHTLEKWSVEEVMQQEAELTAVPFELTEQEREAIAPPKERKPRASKSEHEKAVRLLLDGESVAWVAESTGLSNATVGRFNTVARALRNDPRTDDFGSATGRVHPDLVAIMRDHANRARAL